MSRSTSREAPPPISRTADGRPAPTSAIRSSDGAGFSSNQLTSDSRLVVYTLCQCFSRSAAFMDLFLPVGASAASIGTIQSGDSAHPRQQAHVHEIALFAFDA